MTLVSKAEFARRVKRSPGRISQWLSEGRLHGAAIERTAEGERLNLEVALEQLHLTLDIGQQTGLAAPILPLAPIAEDDDLDPGVAPRESINSDQSRLLKAKADAAETRAEQDRIALMAERGQWVRAADVTASWQRNLGELLGLIEANLPTMAEEVAAELTLDAKAMTIALRRHFRALRQRLADEAAARRDGAKATADEDELVAA